ncbi:ABC transporter permease [Clostridium grantii]|uniref:Oligopeptide transport system permease protein n=1 Tax=Clostridium grantii DSM 8605 TaxID=1121316 RepID=A0A1M5UDG4_9CLOT|nr:ABC transporter permease [Clostridium grantii]SHH60961.1 oligopeptide transport system permease protein [Clostridium grantii DSM 8605]
MTEGNVNNNKWAPIDKSILDNEVIARPSLTYWQDAWRRLKKSPLSMIGLVTIVIILLLAIFGPMLSKYSYSEQQLNFANIPPKFEIYQVKDKFVYVHQEYKLIEVSEKGELLQRVVESEKNPADKYNAFDFYGDELVIDYSYAVDKSGTNGAKFTLELNGEVLQPYDTVSNKSYMLGTDSLGRDVLVRVLYGARISLLVAFIATLVNLIIGVTYGAISGYEGGRTDNIMMRIVDLINTVPLMLYVILLMVVMEAGLKPIIIALGSVYWVSMARLVRGQVLSLKEQEFILAARTLGVSKRKIISKHLIPNAMGPIIVSMTMMIPSAIFTESFLSFIGLGVSAPQASWGTLASDALTSLRSYGYQLLYPSLAICITMFAFNFLGDGLRDALDPRLRK